MARIARRRCRSLASALSVVGGSVTTPGRFRPSEETKKRDAHAVGPPRVPVVVKAEHHDLMLLDEGHLRFEHRVIGERVGRVLMVVERRLVRDDEVGSGRDGALNRVERRHERGRDARHRRVRISGLERVHRLGAPGHAARRKRLFDPVDDLTRRHAVAGLQ